jgi:hypothetical protein
MRTSHVAGGRLVGAMESAPRPAMKAPRLRLQPRIAHRASNFKGLTIFVLYRQAHRPPDAQPSRREFLPADQVSHEGEPESQARLPRLGHPLSLRSECFAPIQNFEL